MIYNGSKVMMGALILCVGTCSWVSRGGTSRRRLGTANSESSGRGRERFRNRTGGNRVEGNRKEWFAGMELMDGMKQLTFDIHEEEKDPVATEKSPEPDNIQEDQSVSIYSDKPTEGDHDMNENPLEKALVEKSVPESITESKYQTQSLDLDAKQHDTSDTGHPEDTDSEVSRSDGQEQYEPEVIQRKFSDTQNSQTATSEYVPILEEYENNHIDSDEAEYFGQQKFYSPWYLSRPQFDGIRLPMPKPRNKIVLPNKQDECYNTFGDHVPAAQRPSILKTIIDFMPKVDLLQDIFECKVEVGQTVRFSDKNGKFDQDRFGIILGKKGGFVESAKPSEYLCFIIRVFGKTAKYHDWEVYDFGEYKKSIACRIYSEGKRKEHALGIYIHNIEENDTRMSNLRWAVRPGDVLYGMKDWKDIVGKGFFSKFEVEKITNNGFQVVLFYEHHLVTNCYSLYRREIKLGKDMDGLRIHFKENKLLEKTSLGGKNKLEEMQKFKDDNPDVCRVM